MNIYKISNKLYFRALKVEPLVTKFLKRYETSYCKLVGLDNRIKSKESMDRKIKLLLYEDININNISKEIKDSLRYTFEIKNQKYSETVTSILKKLSDNGYKLIKISNYWYNEEYKGINVNLITPYNLKIEIQFHTKESYYVKEFLNHPYYEIKRDINSSDDMVKFASEEMKKAILSINIPNGIEKIGNN